MYLTYAEISAISIYLFSSIDFFLQIKTKITPSILPFFPEGLIELSLFESVRLNRDNTIWNINESVEQKGRHTLCWEALLQMLVKYFRNKIGQVWKRLITSSKDFSFRHQWNVVCLQIILLNFECWLIVHGNANQQKYFKTSSDLHRYKYCVLMIPFHGVDQSPDNTMTSKELITSKFTTSEVVIHLPC